MHIYIFTHRKWLTFDMKVAGFDEKVGKFL